MRLGLLCSRCCLTTGEQVRQLSVRPFLLAPPAGRNHKNLARGADRNRTDEWRFCRPLPYHLATAPGFGMLRPALRAEVVEASAPTRGGQRVAEPRRPPRTRPALHLARARRMFTS